MARIQLRRGLAANLPTSGMLAGEPLFTTDRGNLWVALDAVTRVPVTPAIDALQTLATPDLASNLIMVHDPSATGQKEKKMTLQALKDALGIPPASTDEKVAVAAGATPGYLWGTDGTDGVLRMGSSMTWTRPTGASYVTIDVAVVDGGTF